jgi:hypothetical protein
MMTPIHAGSEDYFKQLNGLKTLPSDPATLQYLTHLLNNPNSPFEKFLVGGKIQQIEKDLAAQKGIQAQGQVGGGLPTIKDKLSQTASLLAAQSAAQGRGQMPAPAMPASSAAVSPEEEMQMSGEQPEDMNAAHGGIMSAPLREDTFSFAPGGIVAFAGDNPQGQQVQDLLPTPEKSQSTVGNILDSIGTFLNENLARNKNVGEAEQEAKNIKPGLLEKITPTERANRLANVSKLISNENQGLGATVVTDPAEKAKLEMLRTGNTASVAAPVPAPVARQPGDAFIPRDQIPVMPGPSASVGNNNIIGSRRNMDQIMAEQAAIQAARTKPPVTNIAPAKPNIAPTAPAGDAKGLKMIEDALSKQNTAIDKYTSEISKDKSIEEMYKDIKDADLASGVGSYEKWARENFKEKQIITS